MTSLADVSDLRSRIAGEVIGPEDPEYDEARSVYNAMIDRRPDLVARCTGVADVQAALEASRRNRLDVAIRGGGHNGPGFGTVDGGMVVDLSPMHHVEVDPSRRTVRVQGGATWKMVDTATSRPRTGHAGRDHFHHRRRWAHSRRRTRLPHATLWAHHR